MTTFAPEPVTLADVCCCAGLGADGYTSVGIRVGLGIDNQPQPHYPYPFRLGDAFTSGNPRPWGIYHVKGDSVPSGGRTARDEEHGREVMGSRRLLPWESLKEGFPPAYTAYIGADLLTHLSRLYV